MLDLISKGKGAVGTFTLIQTLYRPICIDEDRDATILKCARTLVKAGMYEFVHERLQGVVVDKIGSVALRQIIADDRDF